MPGDRNVTAEEVLDWLECQYIENVMAGEMMDASNTRIARDLVRQAVQEIKPKQLSCSR